MSKYIPVTPTQFINVMVTAIPELDAAGEVTYKTNFMPEALQILLPDTVINYQLISPTPPGVQFESVEITPDNNQMSVPTIGQSGKILTLSDANTDKVTFNLTLHFKDQDGIRFHVDPEVKNDPQTGPTL